ncbi:MAG: hotdog fold thioesterase [Pseudomonadota bacterium]
MDERALSYFFSQVEKEGYARKMGLRLIKLEPGYALVEMAPQDDNLNIFGTIHGGAIFSLMDEAFQLSCNTHGTVAVALNVTITYHQTPDPGSRLRAESKEIHLSNKTGTYDIKVRDEKDRLIASCLALAYRKRERHSFLEKE